ncbi:Response regulator receiver domain-containing protein [Dyadobacter koreensis]|uniref:Response regulator receiver domain-containing protein n=1 Tax=Dyadobacter koreensis TaxID=408657 RepID=A0A1H6T7X2_9BACT|nr:MULTISPECIES: response regulator [Dyadobacter]MDQ6480754.1 response regulator [Dyadobacter sp. LHD-138]SEI75376.1 Response regulator receiver domain-containing protein [Dyadobacter koreensis]
MESPEKISILYVDDEVNNLNSFKAAFRRDFNVLTVTSGKEGLEVLKSNKVHVIITDQRMPEMTGVDFLIEVLKEYTDPIRILLTGYSDITAVIDAVNKGHIYYYLNKPWDEQQLRIIIKNAYEIFSLREKNRDLLEKLIDANNQLEFLLRQKLIS